MTDWSQFKAIVFEAEFLWQAATVLGALYVIIHAVNARVAPAYILLWGPAAVLLPLETALFLWIFGGRKHGALARAKQRINAAAKQVGTAGEVGGNSCQLLGDRAGRDTLLALRTEILAAKERIHISTYILSPDAVGREIITLLSQRAREGITVRLLVDAIGSWGTPLRLCRVLRRAGGQVARFNPVIPMQGKGSANWRNHRKIAVFDGEVAIIGGQNLGLRYMGHEPTNRRYRDCSFRLAGPAAAAIEHIFLADWCQATETDPAQFTAALQARPPRHGEAEVAVIASGPDCLGDPLWEKYAQLITQAKSSLTIVTPYFIPDKALFKLVIAAAHQGRRVRIIVPRRSDHRLLDFARRWYLRRLKEAGAEILFFKTDFLHAKLFVVDDTYAVIGSANLDMRSLFLNYEIAAVVTDPATLQETLGFIASLVPESTPYSEDLYRRSRTWRGRLLEALGKALAPLL